MNVLFRKNKRTKIKTSPNVFRNNILFGPTHSKFPIVKFESGRWKNPLRLNLEKLLGRVNNLIKELKVKIC